MIFLTSEDRNKLHMGEQVCGLGYMTDINMKKGKLNFSTVNENVVRYKLNSNAKKSEIVFSDELKDNLENESHLVVLFNAKKLKLNIDDILDKDNGGKEKLSFVIMNKDSINYVAIAESSLIEKNYVFIDEINNS